MLGRGSGKKPGRRRAVRLRILRLNAPSLGRPPTGDLERLQLPDGLSERYVLCEVRVEDLGAI